MSIELLKELEKLTGGRLTLGKAISAIRKADEITQANFATTLGVSTQYLCDLEHDRKEVSPQKAATFAHKIGYSEKQFVRLAIQDTLARQGMNYLVELKEAA